MDNLMLTDICNNKSINLLITQIRLIRNDILCFVIAEEALKKVKTYNLWIFELMKSKSNKYVYLLCILITPYSRPWIFLLVLNLESLSILHFDR